jgi:hypothetical protein
MLVLWQRKKAKEDKEKEKAEVSKSSNMQAVSSLFWHLPLTIMSASHPPSPEKEGWKAEREEGLTDTEAGEAGGGVEGEDLGLVVCEVYDEVHRLWAVRFGVKLEGVKLCRRQTGKDERRREACKRASQLSALSGPSSLVRYTKETWTGLAKRSMGEGR